MQWRGTNDANYTKAQHRACLSYLPHGNTQAALFFACFHGVGKTNMTWLEILSFVLVFPKIQLKTWCSVLFLSKKSSLFKTSFWLIDHQKDVDCQKNLIDYQKMLLIAKMSHFVQKRVFCDKITVFGCPKFSEFSEILDHYGSFLEKILSLSLSLSLRNLKIPLGFKKVSPNATSVSLLRGSV